ncbi:MAG: phosphoribosylaminoimidazolesuccinocarboxamide synthase [Pyrinomonadaceae bacterium]
MTTGTAPLITTSLDGLTLLRRGKVRDVYVVNDDALLIVATDRISAFDVILPTPIPRKGEILTSLSVFWFEKLENIVRNHLLTDCVEQMPSELRTYSDVIRGRSMLVKRTEVFPVECVVRGFLAGSGWKDYVKTGKICGHQLPVGLREADKLSEPIFTPATKAEEGHDENISEERACEILGTDVFSTLRDYSLKLYAKASGYAEQRGIIIADTKFEFGRTTDGQIILVDEVLTPDSSRFWPASKYSPDGPQESFDKQFVRDYLESLVWNKKAPAPLLPEEVVEATTKRYLKALELLTSGELNIT